MPQSKKPRHKHMPTVVKMAHISAFTHVIETSKPYDELIYVARKARTSIDKCLVLRPNTTLAARYEHLPRIKA